MHRCRRLDDVHTRCSKACECCPALLSEVRTIRDDDRGHAVLENVHILREACITTHDLREEIIDRRLHTMRERLTGDDDLVEGKDVIEELLIALCNGGFPIPVCSHFRREDGVVLRERILPLQLMLVLRRTRVSMEEACLLDDADKVVPFGTEDTVLRPEVEHVLARVAAALHLLGIEADLAHELDVGHAEHQRDIHRRKRTADLFATTMDIEIAIDHVMRQERLLLFITPEHRREDLEGLMRIERRMDRGDLREFTIDELGESARIIDRTASRPPRDEQRPFREAEVALSIDHEEHNALLVGRTRRDVIVARIVEGRLRKYAVIRPIGPTLRIAGVVKARGSAHMHSFSQMNTRRETTLSRADVKYESNVVLMNISLYLV